MRQAVNRIFCCFQNHPLLPDHGYHADAEAEKNSQRPKKGAAFVNDAFDGDDLGAATAATSSSSASTAKTPPSYPSSGSAHPPPPSSSDPNRFAKPLSIETGHNETLDSGFGATSSSLASISTPSTLNGGVITPGAVLLDSGASSPASSLGGPADGAAGGAGSVKAKKKKLKSVAGGGGSVNSIGSGASVTSSNASASKGKNGAGGRTRKCGATGGLCTIYCSPLQCSAGPLSDKRKTAVT